MVIKFFSWYGGKIRCLPQLRVLISEHSAYYELCAGSAALCLNKSRAKIEVLSDLDYEIYCLHKTMSQKQEGKELCEKLIELEYSKEIFENARKAKIGGFAGMSEMEIAVNAFILISQSFNATRTHWRKGVKQKDYTRRLRNNLPKVYERLQGVQVWNRNCIEVLKEKDIGGNPDAFVFLDVPYRWSLRGKGATNVYGAEMDDEAHIALLKVLQTCKCKVILCGYMETEGEVLYDSYLQPYGWRCLRIASLPKSSQSGKKKRNRGEEFVWLNYEPPAFARYFIDFGAENL